MKPFGNHGTLLAARTKRIEGISALWGKLHISTTTGGERAIKNTLRTCLIFYDILSFYPLMFEIHLLLIHNCKNRNDIRMLFSVSPCICLVCFLFHYWWSEMKMLSPFHHNEFFYIEVNFSSCTPSQISIAAKRKPDRVLTLFATNEEMECNDSFSFS